MKKNKAFTLFELLVSISIIAILTALASISFSISQKKARDSKRVQDLSMIQKAMEQCYVLNNYAYPAVVTSGSSLSCGAGGQIVMDMVPVDPKDPLPAYTYNQIGGGAMTGANYCICADLDDDKGNSNVTDCSAFVNGTGSYFCVKNQQ